MAIAKNPKIIMNAKIWRTTKDGTPRAYYDGDVNIPKGAKNVFKHTIAELAHPIEYNIFGFSPKRIWQSVKNNYNEFKNTQKHYNDKDNFNSKIYRLYSYLNGGCKRGGVLCENIKKIVDLGVQVSIVVGGGNIWRGRQGGKMDRTRADHMGMLATTINSLAIQDVLEQLGIETRVLTAIEMKQFAEPYIRNKAVSHLEKGRVIIFGCGIGSPFFSTDTAAALRAAEIGADIMLFAKNIDGVYTADPKKDPDAKKLDSIEYMDILSNHLTVIDTTATSFSMDNDIPILLFGLDDPRNIIRAVMGEEIGTIVSGHHIEK